MHTRSAQNKESRRKSCLKKDLGVVEQHDSLMLGFLNLDGMSEQTFLDVKRTITVKKLDIVGVVETKRRLEQTSSDILIEGFNKIEVMRSDAADDRDGGGLALYSRIIQGLTVKRVSPTIKQEQNFFVEKERLWITATTVTSKTAICVAYFGCQYPDQRFESWNQSMYEVILDEVQEFEAKDYRVMIMGDFNGHIGAAQGVGIPGNKPNINRNGSMLLSFTVGANMKVLNRDCRVEGDSSTRIAKGLWTWLRGGHTSVIDYGLISAKHISSVRSMEIDEGGIYGGGSDHNWIFYSLKDKFSRLYKHKKKKIPKFTWDIKEDQDWSQYKNSLEMQIKSIDKSSVSSFADSMFSAMYSSAKETIGLKSSCGAPRPCIYPQEIVIELAAKRRSERLWKSELSQFSSSNPPGTKVPPSILIKERQYLDKKLCVSELISKFRSEKRKEEINLCSGNTAKYKKRFWSHVKSDKVKGSSDIPAVRSPISGQLKTEPKEIILETEDFLKTLFHGSFSHQVPILPEKSDFTAPTNEEHSYSSGTTQVLKSNSDTGSGFVHDDPVGFLDADISSAEIQEAIKALDCGKASGLDGLPNEFIMALPMSY